MLGPPGDSSFDVCGIVFILPLVLDIHWEVKHWAFSGCGLEFAVAADALDMRRYLARSRLRACVGFREFLVPQVTPCWCWAEWRSKNLVGVRHPLSQSTFSDNIGSLLIYFLPDPFEILGSSCDCGTWDQTGCGWLDLQAASFKVLG